MKKIMLILAVLAMASSAFAGVTITATDEGGGKVAITYTADSEVRAFALDISVDSGATISAISDYNVGECNSTVQGYGIFMGSIDVNATTGDVNDYGTPVASGKDALGGIDTNGITIELGSLYTDANAPKNSGTLCTITVDPNGASSVNVTLAEEDTSRGGVVMKDASGITATLIGCTLDFGPACWDCPNWALGDIDGDGYVTASDVGPIINFYGQGDGTVPCIVVPCADLDKDGYITASDVGPIINNYGGGDGIACP